MITIDKQKYILKVKDDKIELPANILLKAQFSKGAELTVYKRRDDCIIFEEGLQGIMSDVKSTINEDGTIEIPGAFKQLIKTNRVMFELYGAHSFKIYNHHDIDMELNTYKDTITYSNYGITLPKDLVKELPFLSPGSYVDINVSGNDLILTKSKNTGSRGNTKLVTKYRRLAIPKVVAFDSGIYDGTKIGIRYNKDIIRLRSVDLKEACFITNSLDNTKEIVPGIYVSPEGVEILKEALKNY